MPGLRMDQRASSSGLRRLKPHSVHGGGPEGSPPAREAEGRYFVDLGTALRPAHGRTERCPFLHFQLDKPLPYGIMRHG